jgi:hypothetical protein
MSTTLILMICMHREVSLQFGTTDGLKCKKKPLMAAGEDTGRHFS